MGLFDKLRQQRSARASAALPVPGSHLRTEASASRCVSALDEVLSTYRPRRYQHLPHVVDCGYGWRAPSREPHRVVCFTDHENDFVMVAFWDTATGSQAAVFPVHSNSHQGPTSVIAHWRTRDPTLATIGVIPAGSIALQEPTIPGNYIAGTLQAAGYPTTATNMADMHDMMLRQHLIKAHQFISSEDPVVADAFVERHKRRADLQALVQGLGEWNAAVLPYIQDLPWRIRAIMLEPENLQRSDFWASLER